MLTYLKNGEIAKMSVLRGRIVGGRFSPEHPASSVFGMGSGGAASFRGGVIIRAGGAAPLLMIMLRYDCPAHDLPALAYCWSCNLRRPVVEFNQRTRRGLCGACKGMIFRGGPMHGLTDEEKEKRRELIRTDWKDKVKVSLTGGRQDPSRYYQRKAE